MSKKQVVPSPNLIAECFVSTFKIFTIILAVIIIFNNLVWVYSVSKPARVGDSHIEINQSGNRDIKQEINS